MWFPLKLEVDVLFVLQEIKRLPSLKVTFKRPVKIGHKFHNGKESRLENHPFSGAKLLLVSGSVIISSLASTCLGHPNRRWAKIPALQFLEKHKVSLVQAMEILS